MVARSVEHGKGSHQTVGGTPLRRHLCVAGNWVFFIKTITSCTLFYLFLYSKMNIHLFIIMWNIIYTLSLKKYSMFFILWDGEGKGLIPYGCKGLMNSRLWCKFMERTIQRRYVETTVTRRFTFKYCSMCQLLCRFLLIFSKCCNLHYIDLGCSTIRFLVTISVL